MLSGGLGSYFTSALGSILVVNSGLVCDTTVSLAEGGKDVEFMGKYYRMFYFKEPV